MEVRKLTKTFKVPVRAEGFAASLKSLVQRKYQEVEAVREISFDIEAGEVVGFIGPNGAGKTTSLKILSGLLHPSSGDVRVLGFKPWEREPAYLSQISMVLGNKSQLLWDIPPMDTFRVLAEIYRVPEKEFNLILDELIDLLDMKALLTKPVRNMSLGERMKCELVAGLLYRPRVMFLDEPTLGLDVSMQGRLRRFLTDYNQRSGVTMMLTSHYMADVTALCPRVILIHRGELLYDGELAGLASKLAPFKLVRLALEVDSPKPELPPEAEIVEQENGRLTLRVARAEAPKLTAHLLNTLPVADLSVEDPPIEAVIDQIYQDGEVSA
ncbi:MAG: ATP-binding cassette domain-containing protein [Anaerolineales bacterium]|nr:ATP-binding cassette domain-containing protein [Chloroflexota bacterium]MBL6982121.1 ATP-binding cassette domain-containing protein [Anaerolineales bacterium]